MKDHNPHDPVNMIGEAFELLTEKTMHDLHIQDGTKPASSSKSIRRLSDPYNTDSKKSYWLENRKYLIKNTALEFLSHAGDKTTIELKRLNDLQSQLNKADENENYDINKLYGININYMARPVIKTKTPNYKKCNNKAFRRQQ